MEVSTFGVLPLSDACNCHVLVHLRGLIHVRNSSKRQYEFEVKDVDAAVEECALRSGHSLIHGTRVEPWGQTIARLLGPEGLLIGICITGSRGSNIAGY